MLNVDFYYKIKGDYTLNAIYTRQSVDKKDSISIETQIDLCKREILDENADVKIYSDKGYSGGNTNRPQFQQLMQDIENHKIDKVIVYRLDRISRSLLNFAAIIDLFDRFNVKFVSYTEKLDTSTATGRMMLNLLMVFAQYERESIQLRIKDNYYERGKRGTFCGGGTPYGFDYTKIKIANKNVSVLIQDVEQSSIVKKIYDFYVNQNMSLGEITKILNTENIATSNGGKGWTSNIVGRIIKNTSYVKADADIFRYLELKGCIMMNDFNEYDGTKGLITYGDDNKEKSKSLDGYYVALGLHEGFIESDTWLKAQYRIYNNKQIANSGNSKNTWLSGISKCGYCGYAMTFKGSSKVIKGIKRDYKYIRCSGKTYKACTADMPYINLADAEKDVLNMLFNKLKEDNRPAILHSEKENDSQINSIKLELLSVDKKIENLVSNMMEAENVSMTYINKALNELHKRRKELVSKVEEHNNNASKTSIIDVKKDMDNWEHLDIDNKKKFVRNYINEILFYKDSIKIDFK